MRAGLYIVCTRRRDARFRRGCPWQWDLRSTSVRSHELSKMNLTLRLIPALYISSACIRSLTERAFDGAARTRMSVMV